MDPDFFGTLKPVNGFKKKSLPANDPFAYTTSMMPDGRETFLMTSYRMSRLTYYFAYIAAGFSGIIISRFIIISAFFFIFLGLRGSEWVQSS